MIKISAWNIHGLTEWKHDHPDLLNLLNSNDITCIVESWFSETQCELMKNKLIDKFSILYTCRKKNNRAKRNSGGIIVFIKKCLNKHVSIVQQLDEDILWLRLSKLVTNYEQDLYLCCTYLSPRSSTRYMGDAKRKLELLYEDVVKYRAIGHAMIIGDLNSRTSNLNDFIDINERCDELCTPRVANSHAYGMILTHLTRYSRTHAIDKFTHAFKRNHTHTHAFYKIENNLLFLIIVTFVRLSVTLFIVFLLQNHSL